MKQPNTCVLVASGELARLFDFAGRDHPLVPRPKGQLSAPPVNEPADAQGVTQSRFGTARSKLEPHNAHDKQAEGFADLIAEHLEKDASGGRFEKLVLIAAPRMLGLLRDKLGPVAQSKIWFEIDKNLAGMPDEAITETVNEHLWSS
ncbi:MAG: host attachment protein [Rhodobacteraceae bacterium]|nr:host attachment protein [Paracoccaceae bacterium]